MGGLVAAKASNASKPLGGSIAFLMATLGTAMKFPGTLVTLQLDNSKPFDAHVMNVAVGNGQYHGAGMWVCPGAEIDDGFLNVTVIGHLTVRELIRNVPVLYNGGIYSHSKVQSYRVKHLKANSREPTFVEIDGEPDGRLPLEISILPQTIRVLMP